MTFLAYTGIFALWVIFALILGMIVIHMSAPDGMSGIDNFFIAMFIYIVITIILLILIFLGIIPVAIT